MRATYEFAAINACGLSLGALTDDLAIAVDLQALTPRIDVDGCGPRALARLRLSDGAVHSLEAYSGQLATLTAALSLMIDARICSA